VLTAHKKRKNMENEKIEIADICAELEKLARSGVFTQRTADACTQAASLLSQIREVIIKGLSENWHTPGQGSVIPQDIQDAAGLRM
jgi:hypothetical protein